MEKAKLQRLLHEYLDNTITEIDCIDLLDYLAKTNTVEIADNIILDQIDLDKGPQFRGKQAQDILERIQSDQRFKNATPVRAMEYTRVVKLYQRRWFQIAAAIIILFTGGAIFKFNQRQQVTNGNKFTRSSKSVIIPGTTKASLTLANGQVVYLPNANNGVLIKTSLGSVVKSHNGQIVYNANTDANINNNQIGYNTLTTPKGGEYQVVLPDGTKVWLNAASSITYPVAFTGNERRVKLSGEAYFEVAKNKEKPFYVSINNVQVRVLGTHFNIAAYNDDENITTTLLEGAVQVTKNKSMSLLKPGQQALINNTSDDIAVSTANINDVMAWKNGYFIFNDDSVVGIMKKVSRWYDVDITYRGTFTDQKFGGTYYRSKGIVELLDHLEKIGNIHFTITGRRIIVMN